MSTDAIELSIVIPAYNEARRLGGHARHGVPLPARRSRGPGKSGWSTTGRVTRPRPSPSALPPSEPRTGRAARAAPGQRRRGQGGTAVGQRRVPFHLRRRPLDADRRGRTLPAAVAERFDVAIGTREGLGARRVGEPSYRHVMGRLFNGVVQRLALPGIEDSQCGFKMFTAAAVRIHFPARDD